MKIANTKKKPTNEPLQVILLEESIITIVLSAHTFSSFCLMCFFASPFHSTWQKFKIQHITRNEMYSRGVKKEIVIESKRRISIEHYASVYIQ